MLKSSKDIPDPTAREQLVQQVLSSNRILELYHDDGESSKYFTTIEVRNEETRIIRIANKSIIRFITTIFTILKVISKV
ncbi:hypothetical protein [Orientia tsutsugamushi]|uniref:Putative conjugative transfer protein TraA n=1 Tax=Orientia tsutsugamushi str. TA716 TaxID=1359175 RepID=A0A0F3NNQ0_ORITS|nr:hypothetical protein [Orientia tsutsugamushi]KJV69680.1 putative conjugative transfer protein TraA [Orientia tsutsugamushi str. TA716]